MEGFLHRAIARSEADPDHQIRDIWSPGPRDREEIKLPNILTALPEVSAPQQGSGI